VNVRGNIEDIGVNFAEQLGGRILVVNFHHQNEHFSRIDAGSASGGGH